MIEVSAMLWSGAALVGLAIMLWLASLRHDDVSIVDAFWSLMFLVSAGVYFALVEEAGPRSVMVLALVAAWAFRLASHIAIRNHGMDEDYRYQEIRANNNPGFRYKSFYIVFLLQAVLAWVISLPLLAAVSGQADPGPLDYLGVFIWVIGFIFEWVGDRQLKQFRANPDNQGRVLDSGLWRYTRHPNYFGNFMMWWGFYIIALSAGGWWTLVSPLLMSFLLLRVSGVALLEKDIAERRPSYASYVRQTNAFFPWAPKPVSSS